MTTRMLAWTVEVDRAIDPDMVAAIARIAGHYDVALNCSVSVPAAVITVQVSPSTANRSPITLMRFMSFAECLTSVLDGGNIDDICSGLARETRAAPASNEPAA